MKIIFAPSVADSYQHKIKEENTKRIFDLLRRGQCRSRVDLVRTLGLSATSVSMLVEDLEKRGLVYEDGTTVMAQAGRRPMGLRINAGARQVAVFSLNSQRIRFVLFDLELGKLEEMLEPLDSFSLPEGDSGETYAARFEAMLNRSQSFDPDRAAGICIVIPGVYVESLHRFAMPVAMGTFLSEASMEAFSRRMRLPLLIGKRSACMAYAEKKALDAQGNETTELIFIDACENLSSGILSRGDIFTGPAHTAGEIGHISIDYRGRPCPCGNTGCLGRYLGRSVLLEDIRKACEELGEALPEDLKAAGAAWDRSEGVCRTLNRGAEMLAVGIYSMMCATGIRRIVMGERFAMLGEDKFLSRVEDCLKMRRPLSNGLELSYAHIDTGDDCVGIAHYYLDRVMMITCER